MGPGGTRRDLVRPGGTWWGKVTAEMGRLDMGRGLMST